MGRDGRKESHRGDGTVKPWRMKATVCVKGRVNGVWLEPGGTEEYEWRWLGQRVRL